MIINQWKMPPKAKIYEALTALGDGRVKINGPTEAQVISSSRDKTYTVKWSEDMHQITSNDNASYWRGYIGYPIIAVLLTLDKIVFKRDIATQLKGIRWKKINTKFKHDYEKAIDSVLQNIQTKGEDTDKIIKEVETIYEQLSKLHLERLPRRKLPPKNTFKV